jgi:hypothetical protein
MNDPKLTELLRCWRDVEPPANFEANVWRRIRLANAGRPAEVGWLDWLWQPGVAVLIAAIIGLAVAHPPRRELGFMSAGTLAGGYVKLISGGAR